MTSSKGKIPAFTSGAGGRLRGRHRDGSLQNFPHMPLDIVFEVRRPSHLITSIHSRLCRTDRLALTSSGLITPCACQQEHARLLYDEEFPVVVEDCAEECRGPSRVPEGFERTRLYRSPVREVLPGEF